MENIDFDYKQPDTNPFSWLCSVIDFSEKRHYLKFIHVVNGTAFACSGCAMHWCDVSQELPDGVYDPLTFYPVVDAEISKYSTRIAQHEEHCCFTMMTPVLIKKKYAQFLNVIIPLEQFLNAENLLSLPEKETFYINVTYHSESNNYILGSLPAFDRRELNYKIMGCKL